MQNPPPGTDPERPVEEPFQLPPWASHQAPLPPAQPPQHWQSQGQQAQPWPSQWPDGHGSYSGGASPGASSPMSANRPRQRGLVGWLTGIAVAILAYAKYAVALGLKFGFVTTALSLLLSFGAYAWSFGPLFAAGLVLMILVHEMGHVVEIRRQGMQATAPVFIPFVGAAIFQRSHPTDVVHQALIGIAGPIGGTIGATVAFVLYAVTGMQFFLLTALIGFGLNLFNLIPFGMLDGGWILAPASKWAQLFGLVVLAVAVFFTGGTWILPLIILLGLPVMIDRFRNDRNPYYQGVSGGVRVAFLGAWLALVIFLGYMIAQAAAMASLGPGARL